MTYLRLQIGYRLMGKIIKDNKKMDEWIKMRGKDRGL
jgi:hypothetical protein